MTSSWTTGRIVDICEEKGIITGPFGSLLHAEDYVDFGTPLITVKNIKNNFIDSENIDFVSYEDTKRLRRYTLELDDIVFSRVGNVDQRCIATPEIVGWMISGSCLRLRVDKTKIDPNFLCWLMGHPSFTYLITSYSVGSTRPSLNTSILSNFEISYPVEIKQQKKIAEPLNNIHKLNLLQNKITGDIQNLISTLFRSWFIDFDPVKTKEKGELPYGMDEETASLFPDSFEESELGPIPAGWEIVNYENICKRVFSGGTPNTQESSYWDGVIPWLSSGETRESVISSTERTISLEGVKNSSTRLARKGTTVIASAGQGNTRGQTSILDIDTHINQSIIAVESNLEKVSDLFLFHSLKPRYTEMRYLSDANSIRGSITTRMVKKMKLVLPPKELIERFDSICQSNHHLICEKKGQINSLSKLRELLLPRLMSGELKLN